LPQFGERGGVTESASKVLGRNPGIPVCYRTGDQPNYAYSLKVLEPGEIAVTAGTSGVVYGANEFSEYDPQSSVNEFVHVNDQQSSPRNGIIHCVNGTGSINNWLRKKVFPNSTYEQINHLASEIEIGSDGLLFILLVRAQNVCLEMLTPVSG
jgi:xylulokinase